MVTDVGSRLRTRPAGRPRPSAGSARCSAHEVVHAPAIARPGRRCRAGSGSGPARTGCRPGPRCRRCADVDRHRHAAARRPASPAPRGSGAKPAAVAARKASLRRAAGRLGRRLGLGERHGRGCRSAPTASARSSAATAARWPAHAGGRPTRPSPAPLGGADRVRRATPRPRPPTATGRRALGDAEARRCSWSRASTEALDLAHARRPRARRACRRAAGIALELEHDQRDLHRARRRR